MKKVILTIAIAALAATGAFAQVGINNETPKATLDVVGKPTDVTVVDGLIAPRIEGNQLAAKDAVYTTAQTGAVVYALSASPTASASGKTINVSTPGYYYFDGSLWQALKSVASGSTTNYTFSYNPTTHILTINDGTTNTEINLNNLATASNGLTANNDNIQLGGPLTQNTTVDNGTYGLTFGSTSSTGAVTIYNLNIPGGATGDVLTKGADGSSVWKTPNDALTKSSALTGASVSNAGVPLVINNGTSQLVGVGDATFTVNNTAALWNANAINSTAVVGNPTTTNNTLIYNGTNLTFGTANSALTKTNALTGASVSNAGVPLVINNGTSQLVGVGDATFTVNNTAPLWNANEINGTVVTGTPDDGQVLTFNLTTNKLEWKTPQTGSGGDGQGIVTLTSPDNTITVTGSGTSAATVSLADNSVTSAKIVNGTIKGEDIAVNTITNNNIAGNGTTNQILISNGTGTTWGTANDALTKTSALVGGSVSNAGVPLVINNGTSQLVGVGDATFTVNNTAALWNANAINSTAVVGNPTNTNNTLIYNGTNLTFGSANSALTKNAIVAGATPNPAALVPLTVGNGTSQVVGGTDATLTVNNTAPLWNANEILGTLVTGSPTTTNNTLIYNGTNLTFGSANSALATKAITAVTSNPAATVPLTVTNGTGQVVGANDAQLAVNNTAALWNANEINGKNITVVKPTDGQVLTYNTTKDSIVWATPASGGASNDINIYKDDGTLTSPRTVTQNNQNLTFTTGATAKTIINGNFQMGGAVYASSVRTYTGATNVDWNANDYVVIVTNINLSANLALPDPSGVNTGRILCISNHTTVPVGPPTANGINWPLDYNAIAAGSSSMFISDGTKWWNMASR